MKEGNGHHKKIGYSNMFLKPVNWLNGVKSLLDSRKTME